MARGSIELRQPVRANLSEYFLLCLRVGLLSFGGGLSGWMYREIVDQRRWMAGPEFLSALGLAQILPGTNISNLTVAIGQRLFGFRGAIAGLVGLLVGPFFVVIALVTIYGTLSRLAWVGHFLDGVAAAAIGLLLLTSIRAGQQVAKSVVPVVVMAATFIAIGVLRLPLVPVVLCIAPVSIALAWRTRRVAAEMREKSYLALIAVLVPFSLISVGGGPTILAGLQHQAVEVHQWVAGREFVDLFALARAAPGPGSMIVTLLGWKVAGWSGALVATLAFYAPSSLLCYTVANIWNRYRGRSWHGAFERGMAPVAAGLLFAGSLAIARLADAGIAYWVVALAALAMLIGRPRFNILVLLVAGGIALSLWETFVP